MQIEASQQVAAEMSSSMSRTEGQGFAPGVGW